MRTSVLVALALCAAALAPARAEEGTPVSIDVGSTRNLCASGIVTCPVASFLCDDPNVAVIEYGAEGAVLRGVVPGTTLCAVSGSAGNRRLLRVTVLAKKPAGAAPAR
jgi:hypothetical protein